MNIAHLLPASVQMPLIDHNGRYEWVLRLASLQAAAGHTVTIYCASGSSFPAEPTIQWASLKATDVPFTQASRNLFLQALEVPKHNIFHSHFDSLHYSVADASDKPIVVTQHWFPNAQIAAASRENIKHNVIVVPVTHYMRQVDSDLGMPCSKTIYHGIDLSLFTSAINPLRERLLFVGRISPQKGVIEAIQFANSTNQQLDIVGKLSSKYSAYWEEVSRMIDGKRIRYLGTTSQAKTAQLLSQAKAMIFLPQNIEAFGQTIIEAQACGTPVILNDLGANAELIVHGKTGYLLGSDTSPKDVVSKLTQLSGADCQAFAANFDLRTMASAYSALYRDLLA